MLGSRPLLATALALAIAVPVAGRALLSQRVARLADRLGHALGAEVTIDRVEVGLSGTVSVRGITVDQVFAADALDASVGAASLLAGQLRADEIVLRRPRLSLAVGADGQLNVAPLVRRAAEALHRRPGAGTGQHRPRRIRVDDGDLEIGFAGGTVRASGVELWPQGDRVRVVTGAVRAELRRGTYRASAAFERAGLDLELPDLAVPRLLLPAGHVELASGDRHLALDRVSLSRGVGDDAVRLIAAVDDGEVGQLRATVRRRAAGLSASVDADKLGLALLAPLLPAGLDLGQARYSGHLDLALVEQGVDLGLDGDLSQLVVTDPRVASRPVTVDAHLGVTASLRRLAGRIYGDLVRGDVALGAVSLHASGRGEWSLGATLPARGDVRAALDPLACAGLGAALSPLLGDALAGMDGRGELVASARLRFDRGDPDATHLDLAVDTSRCHISEEPALADVHRLLQPFELRRPDGSTARIGDGDDYTPLSSLPRHVLGAFVAAEDARFFHHGGFDPLQIERSLAIDLAEGRLLRGGSTISQQLVKNAFLGHERTAVRKLAEAILTWRLETVVGKKLILERYLNLIELGDGVYGIGAASRHYFGKSARHLSIGEAAFLAALTPAPRTFSRRLREEGGLDADLERRVQVVLRAMRQSGVIDRAAFDQAARHHIHVDRRALARAP